MKKAQMKKVLAFGTFDRLHKGHLFFLKEARKLGRLYVSVASDESTFARKRARPRQSARQRMGILKGLGLARKVSEGDKTLGGWTDIKRTRPDIVAVGYDQKELGKVLKKLKKKYGFKIKNIKSFKPKIYHSSIKK